MGGGVGGWIATLIALERPEKGEHTRRGGGIVFLPVFRKLSFARFTKFIHYEISLLQK